MPPQHDTSSLALDLTADPVQIEDCDGATGLGTDPAAATAWLDDMCCNDLECLIHDHVRRLETILEEGDDDGAAQSPLPTAGANEPMAGAWVSFPDDADPLAIEDETTDRSAATATETESELLRILRLNKEHKAPMSTVQALVFLAFQGLLKLPTITRALLTGRERANRNLITDLAIRAVRHSIWTMHIRHTRRAMDAFATFGSGPITRLLMCGTEVSEVQWSTRLRVPTEAPIESAVSFGSDSAPHLTLTTTLLDQFPRTEAEREFRGRADWVVPPTIDSDRVVMFVHGGAYLFGSKEAYTPIVAQLAQLLKRRFFNVYVVALLSALSPWTDMVMDFPSMREEIPDVLIYPPESQLGSDTPHPCHCYVGREVHGADEAMRLSATHPMISPNKDMGDPSSPWPPVYMTTGTDEKLLDENVLFASHMARLVDRSRATVLVHDVFTEQPHVFPIVAIGHPDTQRVHQRLASFVREIADVQSSRPPYRVEVSLYSNGKLVSRDAAKIWGPRWAGIASTHNLVCTPNYVRASAGLVLSEPPSLDASSVAMAAAAAVTTTKSPPAMAEADPSATDAVPVAMDDMQRMTRLQRRSVADIKKAVASVQRTSSFLVAQRRASQSETAATMA
ncbi:hypothetical protein H9P43_001158 [Blastocladiella emersonii ATCC 22665]|nr:hypothetical protein H9P43_001158 [Blastocladiella emersonii ATCC 22665]